MTVFYFVSILSESEEFSFVSAEAKALLKAVPNVYDVREDERGEEEARCENPFFAHVSFLFGKRELPESVFSISAVYDKEAGKTRIGIFGSGVSEVFCGLYTCLERSGFSFTSSGVVVPQECGFTFSEERLYTPAVKRRGVRLHLNFPMDISSYPLVRAKQYVRNLARLRYNAIAFHSYPGQFCEQTEERKKCLAGNYFYGEVQPIAEISYLKDLVENENYYCIPEGEVYYNDAEKSAAYAVFWLRTLMRECKKYGMKVVFSFEPRDMTYEETERTVKWIERNYPDADLIELCTEECGKGWDPAAAESVEEIENLIRASYGSAFLSHPVIKEICRERGAFLNCL